MNTAIATKPVRIIRTDSDGNVYSIPVAEVDNFTYMVEDVVNADFESPEWYDAVSELETVYGKYRKG